MIVHIYTPACETLCFCCVCGLTWINNKAALLLFCVLSSPHNYSAGPVIEPPAYWANPVIGPSKGLHQVSAITRELREAIGGFKRQKYDFCDTNVNEFIF
jgi:hypothetical protein